MLFKILPHFHTKGNFQALRMFSTTHQTMTITSPQANVPISKILPTKYLYKIAEIPDRFAKPAYFSYFWVFVTAMSFAKESYITGALLASFGGTFHLLQGYYHSFGPRLLLSIEVDSDLQTFTFNSAYSSEKIIRPWNAVSCKLVDPQSEFEKVRITVKGVDVPFTISKILSFENPETKEALEFFYENKWDQLAQFKFEPK